MNNSSKLKRIYFDWLMKEYSFTDLDKNVVEISIPFLDNDFDYLTMYAEFLPDGKILLTDDGWTLDNLKSHGITFTERTKAKKATLRTITSSLGIEIQNKELCIKTDLDKFPIAKQRLLQAIIQVNDMIVLQSPHIKTIFHEEIEQTLNKRKVFFSSRPSYAGKEGITVQFDFVVPIHKKERLVRTISNGNNLNHAKLLAMDTRLLHNHKKNVEYIALIDDINHNFSKLAETQAIFQENSADHILILPHREFMNNPNALTNIV
ncbi:DUF1828 domain-containing protein [Streptococcus halichoeri]|uniref:DUF1828 domain-containing protein n=1 Tax=Streptococcus halichoeri TaxID=254785 RepID=UPI00135994DB|nr:DUF1828 domain-containing protein [Streptococcus halichoeri]